MNYLIKVETNSVTQKNMSQLILKFLDVEVSDEKGNTLTLHEGSETISVEDLILQLEQTKEIE